MGRPLFLNPDADPELAADSLAVYAYSFLHSDRAWRKFSQANQRHIEDFIGDITVMLFEDAASRIQKIRRYLEARCGDDWDGKESDETSPCWRRYLNGWLRRRAFWSSIDWLKRKGLLEVPVDFADEAEQQPVARHAPGPVVKEIRDALARCLEKVDEKTRLTVLFRTEHGMSWKEVASAVGESDWKELANHYDYRRRTKLVPCLERHGISSAAEILDEANVGGVS